jgi:phospholipid/cholesterol/gamma-HCH transport system substrate-binding protein
MNRAIWLGFMFFVALVLLGFGTLLVINLNPFAKTQNLQVYFDHVQGLRKGDMVRVDGVMLGKVEEIALRRESGVLVLLGLASPIALFSDAEILVESSSILGGSFVSIRRGNQPPEIDLREPLAGKNRLGLEQLGDLASENRENLKQLIANLKEVTQTLRDGQGSLGKLLRTDTLHKEAVETLQGVREDARRIGDTLNQNVTKLTDKLTEKMDKAEGPVGALLNDKKMTEQLTRTMDNVEETSKNLKAITDSVKKGEGALGKLVTDHEMGDKLKTTIDNIEKSSASIRNITGSWRAAKGPSANCSRRMNSTSRHAAPSTISTGRSARQPAPWWRSWETPDPIATRRLISPSLASASPRARASTSN